MVAFDGRGDGQGWNYGYISADNSGGAGDGHIAYSGNWYWQCVANFFIDEPYGGTHDPWGTEE